MIEQTAPRVLETASAGILVVFGLVVLVIASLAFPRYQAAPADASALAVKSPDVPVASPQPEVAAQSDVPPVKTIATPVRVGPVDHELPISQVKAPRRINEKPNKASDARAAGKSPTGSMPPTATTSTSAAVSTPKADTSGLTPVTVTGCLEISIDSDRFRLTDIEGTNAPKARSWRSGFLRKRPAPLELVELADPLTPRKYVGQRVVATGLVENRKMWVHSLQAGGHACSQ